MADSVSAEASVTSELLKPTSVDRLKKGERMNARRITLLAVLCFLFVALGSSSAIQGKLCSQCTCEDSCEEICWNEDWATEPEGFWVNCGAYESVCRDEPVCQPAGSSSTTINMALDHCQSASRALPGEAG